MKSKFQKKIKWVNAKRKFSLGSGCPLIHERAYDTYNTYKDAKYLIFR